MMNPHALARFANPSKQFQRLLMVTALGLAAANGLTASGVQGATPLTPTTLGTFLKSAGYETGTTSPGVYTIQQKLGRYTFHPTVALSVDGKRLWLTSTLKNLTDEDLANGSWLLAVMKANGNVQPAQFSIVNAGTDAAPEWLFNGSYPIDNRGITSTVFKEAAENFVKQLVDQVSLWAPSAPPVGK